MAITQDQVKTLREMTGAGIMDCKRALTEAGGDLEKAKETLRKRGVAVADKKSGRATNQGAVGSYIHMGGRVGVMLELSCETDFVAKNEKFQSLLHDIAMHIAAMKPRWLSREDVEEEVLAKEREIYRELAVKEGKPEKILDRIVEGRIEKFYTENCLLDQLFVKDDSKKIGDLLRESIATTGENILVRRFVRYEVGE